MAIDLPAPPNPMRRRVLWSSLGLVLVLCAWLAAHGDQDPTTDIARPLTHAASGVIASGHVISSVTDPKRERRIVASIAEALRAPSVRADFPALTDAGRHGWAGAVQPVVATVASSPALAASASTAFPFQWVGLWTQPASGSDNPESQAKKQATPQPIAVIAGPHSTWMVKQGDLLDEDWKIASISATQLQVIYLPSMARETISMSKQ